MFYLYYLIKSWIKNRSTIEKDLNYYTPFYLYFPLTRSHKIAKLYKLFFKKRRIMNLYLTRRFFYITIILKNKTFFTWLFFFFTRYHKIKSYGFLIIFTLRGGSLKKKENYNDIYVKNSNLNIKFYTNTWTTGKSYSLRSSILESIKMPIFDIKKNFIKISIKKNFYENQIFWKNKFFLFKTKIYKKINFNYILFKKKINNIKNIKFKISNLLKLNNFFSLKNLNINFLRKNKVFNKSRYSRNRQYYRTGVYWCLYINIIAILGFYFWFHKITFNFGYIWWILYLFINSFVLPQFLFNNSLWFSFLKFIFTDIVWLLTIVFNFIYNFIFINLKNKFFYYCYYKFVHDTFFF